MVNESKLPQNRQYLVGIARKTSIVAGIFSVILFLLIIVNYFQLKTTDPINSPALQSLLVKLGEDPQNQDLKEEIRSLDLLARKAYFTKLWQLQTGGYLFLFFIGLCFVALKTVSYLQPKQLEAKPEEVGQNWWQSLIQSRRSLYYFGASFLVIAFVIIMLSQREMLQTKSVSNDSSFLSENEILENWMNFRGPYGNGIAHFTNAPTVWDGESNQNILWKVELPQPGNSSPIVWKEKIFLSGGNKDKLEVYCCNLDDGTMLWQKEVQSQTPDGKKPTAEDYTGYAAPTMATDGQFVFAIFATGDIAGFDMDGNQIWAQNLGVPENHYGHSSSLITFRNLVFVQFDDYSNPRILALDVASGNTVWEQPRGEISWASPICVNTGKRMELILTNSKSATAYDPLTGNLLWKVDCLSGEVGPSPAYANGVVFVANEYATGTAIKIPEAGNQQPEILWEFDENLPNASSPLMTEHYVILTTGDGYVSCLNAQNGELLWEQEFDRGFYSSPILVGNRVYVVDLKGNMQIFKLDKEYQFIAESKLGEESTCTAAFLDGKIIVRGKKYLYCIKDLN